VTVLIFNVGFTAEYVIRAISRRSIDGVNKIFLVAMESKDDYSKKRSSEAIGSILDFLKIAGVTDVDVVKVNVDWSFDAILEYVSEKIGGYDDYEFHLVGGTRMTLLALYYLALLLSAMPGVKVKAIAYDEAMTSSKELPLRVPSVPTKEKLDVLEAIGAGATVYRPRQGPEQVALDRLASADVPQGGGVNNGGEGGEEEGRRAHPSGQGSPEPDEEGHEREGRFRDEPSRGLDARINAWRDKTQTGLTVPFSG